MDQYIDLLTEAVNMDKPFIDKFYQTLWRYLDISRKNDRLNKLVHFCSLHTPKNREDSFSQQVNDHYHHVLTLLETLISQGAAAGFLPKTTDCEAISLVLLSLTEGHIYMSILEDRLPLERIYTSLFSLLPQQNVPRQEKQQRKKR